MKTFKQLLVLGSLLAAAVPAMATTTNVALGGAVTPQGSFGVGGSWWGSGPLAPAASLTDGIFLPESTQWNTGSIWWGSTTPFSSDNFLIVDLGSSRSFDRLVLQADNNDAYAVDYWNGQSWVEAWQASAVGGWGMATRSSSIFPALTSQYLRVHAVAGDTFYSVSELQALAPVPEPETWAMMAAGLLGTAALSRRRRRAV